MLSTNLSAVPQHVGWVCWSTVAMVTAYGLINTNQGLERKAAKAAGRTLVNSNLATPTSDFWTFALLSSASAIGLACAFVEKAALYDNVHEENGAISVTAVFAAAESASESFTMNLWLGVLFKALAVVTCLLDLVLGRRFMASPSHIFLDFLEASLFFLLLWMYENGFSPLEKSLKGSERMTLLAGPQGQVSVMYTVETMMIELIACISVSLMLAVLPWLRFYRFCTVNQEKSVQIFQDECDSKTTVEQKGAVTDSSIRPALDTRQQEILKDETTVESDSAEHQDCSSDCEDEFQEDKHDISDDHPLETETVEEHDTVNPSTDKMEEPVSDSEAIVAKTTAPTTSSKSEKKNDCNSNESQNADLLLGGILCGFGVLMSYQILRRFKH